MSTMAILTREIALREHTNMPADADRSPMAQARLIGASAGHEYGDGIWAPETEAAVRRRHHLPPLPVGGSTVTASWTMGMDARGRTAVVMLDHELIWRTAAINDDDALELAALLEGTRAKTRHRCARPAGSDLLLAQRSDTGLWLRLGPHPVPVPDDVAVAVAAFLRASLG